MASDMEPSPLCVIELPQVLDIKAVAPLTGEFLAARGKPLDVDASAVQRIGGQCLQVLLSAAPTWGSDGVPFAFTNMSRGFVEGLARLGVSLDDFQSQDRRQ